MEKQMTYKEAWALVGGLSEPSKMPCYGWSVSAKRCGVGSKLHKVEGSVCYGCYALRGNYMFANVQSCLEKRFEALHKDTFVPAMVYLLKCITPTYFRWYDSGDLDSVATLRKLVDIANQLPGTKFWLPTKEYGIVQSFLKEGGIFPSNLNVRLSGYMVDKQGPIELAKALGVTISEVLKEGWNCPASTQGNKCLECRACWDKNTFVVAYKKH